MGQFSSDARALTTTLPTLHKQTREISDLPVNQLSGHIQELEDLLARSEQKILDYKVKVDELEAGKKAAMASRSELRSKCRELEQIINNSPVGLLKLTEDGYITSANTMCRAILQTPTTVLQNSPFAHYLTSESQKKFCTVLSQVLHTGVIQRVSVSVKETRSHHRQHLVLLARSRSSNAVTSSLIATVIDVSKQQDTEDQLRNAKDYLERLAHKDTLTNLSNRNRFSDILRASMVRSRKSQSSVALLYFDIDGFKSINDRYGHHAGDTLLRETANRLRSRVRDASRLARLGGDEFALVLEHTRSQESVMEEACHIAATIRQPISLGDVSISVTSSIGVCIYPIHANTPDDIMKGADAAMYKAKREGGDGARLFDNELKKAIHRSNTLIASIDSAIEEDQFELLFQPIIEMMTSTVLSAEALIRWNHPDYGLISPTEFIPLAESSGKIEALGYWVVKAACVAAKNLLSENVDIKLCVNLSAKQFEDIELGNRILEAVRAQNLDSSAIVFEITESTAMSDNSVTVVDKLMESGFELAIDDFGTGYSSLARLRHLSVSWLKLDKMFLDDIVTSDDALVVVEGVIFMAHELGLKVVAEGVESIDQKRILEELSCDLLQGHLMAKPLSFNKLLSFLRSKSKGSFKAPEEQVNQNMKLVVCSD